MIGCMAAFELQANVSLHVEAFECGVGAPPGRRQCLRCAPSGSSPPSHSHHQDSFVLHRVAAHFEHKHFSSARSRQEKWSRLCTRLDRWAAAMRPTSGSTIVVIDRIARLSLPWEQKVDGAAAIVVAASAVPFFSRFECACAQSPAS